MPVICHELFEIMYAFQPQQAQNIWTVKRWMPWDVLPKAHVQDCYYTQPALMPSVIFSLLIHHALYQILNKTYKFPLRWTTVCITRKWTRVNRVPQNCHSSASWKVENHQQPFPLTRTAIPTTRSVISYKNFLMSFQRLLLLLLLLKTTSEATAEDDS